MPISIAFVLAVSPILTLSMLSSTGWPSEILSAAKLALGVSLIIVILWVVLDATRSARDRWQRFLSRPY